MNDGEFRVGGERPLILRDARFVLP